MFSQIALSKKYKNIPLANLFTKLLASLATSATPFMFTQERRKACFSKLARIFSFFFFFFFFTGTCYSRIFLLK